MRESKDEVLVKQPSKCEKFRQTAGQSRMQTSHGFNPQPMEKLRHFRMTEFTTMHTNVPTGLVRTGTGMRQKMCVSPPPVVEMERPDDPYLYPITTKSQHPPIFIDGEMPRQSSIVFTTSKTQETSPDMRVAKRKSFLHVNYTDPKQA